MRVFNYYINQTNSNITVRDFLRKKGFSKQILVSMKPYPEAVLLNGKHPFMDDLLHEKDSLVITLPPEEPSEKIVPVKLPLSVIYEDEDILVVNKPPFMPVHPSQGHYENTLANAVAYHMKAQNEDYVFRCINRLDRDTSGVLIIAKNALSAAVLYQQMRERKIRRTYLALVEGMTEISGIVNAPIARVHNSTIMREVNFEKGETAITHYQRLAYQNGLSLIELHLETGRTHQIRVHMKYIGHPLPGDFLYNPEHRRINRQPLHSFQLDFIHPVTEQSLCFMAPVPEDIQSAFYSSNENEKAIVHR